MKTQTFGILHAAQSLKPREAPGRGPDGPGADDAEEGAEEEREVEGAARGAAGVGEEEGGEGGGATSHIHIRINQLTLGVQPAQERLH